MKVTPTSFVTIDFQIRTLEDTVNTSQPEELSFCLGLGLMPPALEEALIGMSRNEHRVVRLTPQQAFGEVDEDLIIELDRADFEAGVDPMPGDVYEATDDEGQPVFFVVKSLGPETVVADFNHSLAGKEVEFLVTLKDVRETTPEDAGGFACPHCGGTHPHEH
ncbi:MAG: FKBP-type peptidyl-prolyl cis-trans isomerase [Desulfobaccales bacterium]